jgi:hypothetical protein
MHNYCLGVFNLDLHSKYLDCSVADLTEIKLVRQMPSDSPTIVF